jgi:hypothetical protein
MATCVAWRVFVVAQLRIDDPLQIFLTNKEELTKEELTKEELTNKEYTVRADLPLKLTKGMA